MAERADVGTGGVFFRSGRAQAELTPAGIGAIAGAEPHEVPGGEFLPDPVWWLARARLCPELAFVLVQSMGVGYAREVDDWLLWPRRFVRRPPWCRIADGLTSGRNLAEPDLLLHVARLARAIAARRLCAPPEAAFWFTLFHGPAPQLQHLTPIAVCAIESSDPLEWCRRCAWRLVAQPDASALRHSSALAPDATTLPDADAGLIHDADGPPAWRVSAAKRRRLIEWAFASHLRQEIQTVHAAVRLCQLHSIEPFGTALARLLANTVGDDVPLWLPGATECAGYGIMLVDGQENAETDPNATRSAFETTRLPASFRSSRELHSAAGELVGVAYFKNDGLAIDGASGLGLAVQAIAHWRERQQLVDENVKLIRSASQLSEQLASAATRQWRSMLFEFSAGAAHMIHNPLATISGRTQRLLTDESDPTRRAALHKIAEQVGRIEAMIRDLHLVGRREQPVAEEITLDVVLQQAAADAAAHGPAAALTVEPVDAAILLSGNSDDLARLFAEIIRNGLEAAGPTGSVLVRARRERHTILVDVTDSGPGFSPNERDHAFEPFFSGHSAGRGLGMGLTVALRIATDYGGAIKLAIGRPSAVRVILPAAIAAGKPRAECPATT